MLQDSPPKPPQLPRDLSPEEQQLLEPQEPVYVPTTPKSLLSYKGTSKSVLKKIKGQIHTGRGAITLAASQVGVWYGCTVCDVVVVFFSHTTTPNTIQAVTNDEYNTLKAFPNLASDALSFSERRKVIPRRLKQNSLMGSLASTRSVRSTMSELTKSPFEDEDDGPLTSIRRNMMMKKRHARSGVLPAVSRRQSVQAMHEKLEKATALGSALHKVKKAAKKYDRYKDGQTLTSCFADYQMEAAEFRMQMRRAIGVALTKKEAAALHKHADRDKSGTIDGAEFLLMFFKEAHEEHSKDFQKRVKIKEQMEEEERVKKEREEKELIVKDYACFTTNFTVQDTKRVMRRLAKEAFEFDVTSESGKRTSKNFCCELRPAALKEQLYKSFNMKVTKAELGALIAQFDQDGDGDVSGAEFMNTFSKLGQIARRNERKKRDQVMNMKLKRGLILPLVRQSLGR